LTDIGRNNEDCSHHKAAGRPTGVYTIYPNGIPNGISVYCDMDTDGGGWTVRNTQMVSSLYIHIYTNIKT